MGLRGEVSDLSGSLVAPLRALGVTLGGVWLAWRWLSGARLTPIVVAIAIMLFAYACDLAGRSLLPNHPRWAIVFLEWWIVAPLTLGAVASAVVVILSVKLWMPEDAPLERKELIGALSTGLATFLTSVLISWAGDQDASRLAQRIERRFSDKYKRPLPDVPREPGVKYFKPNSRGDLLVHSKAVAEVEGWGREARHKRGSKLSEEIRSGNSDAPLE